MKSNHVYVLCTGELHSHTHGQNSFRTSTPSAFSATAKSEYRLTTGFLLSTQVYLWTQQKHVIKASGVFLPFFSDYDYSRTNNRRMGFKASLRIQKGMEIVAFDTLAVSFSLAMALEENMNVLTNMNMT